METEVRRRSTSRSSSAPAPTTPTTTSCCPRASTPRVHREDPGDHGALVHRGSGRGDRQAFRPVAHRHGPLHRPGRPDPLALRGARASLAARRRSTAPRDCRAASGGVSLPVEFQRLIRPGAKVLLVEDLVSTGSTLTLLSNLVEQLGGLVVGIGCLWRRTSVDLDNRPVFSLVSRDFPTYDPDNCPLLQDAASRSTKSSSGAATPAPPRSRTQRSCGSRSGRRERGCVTRGTRALLRGGWSSGRATRGRVAGTSRNPAPA